MRHYYSLVLHAHLPYVLHKEPNRLEERWLYEAVTETYIPLLWGLEESKEDVRYTLSISPPVLEMLADDLFQQRYMQYIDQTLELLNKEQSYVKEEGELKVVHFYSERYKKIKQTFLEWNCNLISAFRFYMQESKMECITTSATHAFLPFLQTEQGVRAQIVYGLECFQEHFGFRPDGIWLPECAFTPGVDKILFEEGIRYTFVDEKTIQTLDPKPANDHSPVYSPHGVVLFPRRIDLSTKVWDAISGYPGDHDYREFYRDVGYDRDFDYIKPYIHQEGIRLDTGLKYHRISGETEHKEVYTRDWALDKVEQHAKDFVNSVSECLVNTEHKDCPLLSLTSFDAELFGHWWFEGPEWITKIQEYSVDSIEWITPSEFIKRHYQELSTHHACFSTWGRDNYGDVWLNETNSWIYRHLHTMEHELIKQSTRADLSNPIIARVIKQMTREWLLATSSDWAFIMDHNTATDYAIDRTKEHIQAFSILGDLLKDTEINEDRLRELEDRYSFMDWMMPKNLTSAHDEYILGRSNLAEKKKEGLNILMLSWEFPPMIVGGLARHVFDLSKALVRQGHNVYVLTSHVEEYPEYEVNQGVHVYRVKGAQPHHEDFFHWVGSLNLAMADLGRQLGSKITFDCIHAHDWIVSVAAKGLKQQLNIPLYVTIHATEHGRYDGIHNDIQSAIHAKEWELMYEAEHIIVCSAYMARELVNVFEVPEQKISIIPNGVDPLLIPNTTVEDDWKFDYGCPSDFFVFSLGRIVPEKGFSHVIDCAAMLRNDYPSIKFIIAGKGPMLDEYRQKVSAYHLEDRVFFVGFVTDEQRNQFLHQSDALIFPSLYEPFGIVALEGMAAETPIIVSDTGGLGDVVDHGRNGLKVYPGNPESIRDQIVSLYKDSNFAERLVTEAGEEVKSKYNWDGIAVNTSDVLSGAVKKPITVGVK